jgi:peptidylprolyl isomerase
LISREKSYNAYVYLEDSDLFNWRIKMKKSSILILFVLLSVVFFMPACAAAAAHEGNTVQVNYTGKFEDGTVFDSCVGKSPLEFKLGEGRIIPGFENAVMGMKVGEKKTVTIPASDAYGPYRPELTIEVPRTQLPADPAPQIGQQLQSQTESGSIIVVTITKVSETSVTVDANHPLAGKDLIFDIELLKIS